MFKFIYKIILFACVILFSAILYLFFTNLEDLPNFSKLENYSPPIVTRLYTADGRLLEEYAKEHRFFVPIEAIPKQLQYAFIAAEDKNFYSHAGVDFFGVMRAVKQNITNYIAKKNNLVGGSTITQQVIKNFLLSNEKTINRKVKEAILAYKITASFTKEKTLELYLNQIYLGSRSYGVASAALHYFGKSINELTIEESALLASLPKAPSVLMSSKNKDRVKLRRDWVIDRMTEDGYITDDQAEEAKAKPIILKPITTNFVKADFFAEAVRQQIAGKFGENVLYEGGLYVQTTLDPELQKIAEDSLYKGVLSYDYKHGYRGIAGKIQEINNWLKELSSKFVNQLPHNWEYGVILSIESNKWTIGLKNGHKGYINFSDIKFANLQSKSSLDKFNVGDVLIVKQLDKNSYSLHQIPKIDGGVIIMDPHLGRVLAMVGGFDPVSSKFNRTYQAFRQSGSVFKPFVYLLAMENNFKPNMLINDGPISIDQGPGLPKWSPKNYQRDFLGDLPLRLGLEKSRNTMTINLASKLGISNIIDITKRFGINDNPPPYLSIVLGAIETNLLRMTNAYSMIVNGGKKISPTLIEKIQDKYGKILFKSDVRRCINCEINSQGDNFTDQELTLPILEDKRQHVTDNRSAYQLISILEGGILHRASNRMVKNLNTTLAGKSGTTNDSKDTWYIGFSPDLVVGVYLGFDEPKSLGNRETGSTVAQPVFVNIMKEALKGKQDVPFRMPKGVELLKVDLETGIPSNADTGTIYEVFKSEQLYE
jgi:penicillin-binding protein 1A